MEMAVAEAAKSTPEDRLPRPRVGVVVVKDDKVLAVAHRGELEPGEHAEFTVLEKKLSNEQLAGSTVYTTLEPCTHRNHPKVPCATRLIERRVDRVVIGMVDPNPVITGRGQLALRSAGINISLFDSDLMAQLEELNRDFTRAQQAAEVRVTIHPGIIQQAKSRGLDEWYRALNSIYWNRNFQRDSASIFMHLVEVIGALSLLASTKKKPDVKPETYVPKALAWWLALCGKLGVISVEQLLWDKFPSMCTYCLKMPHDPDICFEEKAKHGGPQWEMLANLGKSAERPRALGDWQSMFSQIYPAQQTEDYGPSFARLTEELGELAEAIRVFPAEPGYFLSEAADVFAWLMHIQNIIEQKRSISKRDRGSALNLAFAEAYPDSCRDCGKVVCACPPILKSTIGRIAHEVPAGRGTYGKDSSRFMTPDLARHKFAAI